GGAELGRRGPRLRRCTPVFINPRERGGGNAPHAAGLVREREHERTNRGPIGQRAERNGGGFAHVGVVVGEAGGQGFHGFGVLEAAEVFRGGAADVPGFVPQQG